MCTVLISLRLCRGSEHISTLYILYLYYHSLSLVISYFYHLQNGNCFQLTQIKFKLDIHFSALLLSKLPATCLLLCVCVSQVDFTHDFFISVYTGVKLRIENTAMLTLWCCYCAKICTSFFASSNLQRVLGTFSLIKCWIFYVIDDEP